MFYQDYTSFDDRSKELSQRHRGESSSSVNRSPGHQCHLCHYRSTTPFNIKKHIRYRHTGEKPFQCSMCGKFFAENSSLQVHLRIHTGEKPFQCSICFTKFTQNISLKKHLKTHHS
ncbi:Zinc finger and BTB domain-containing protein 7A [Armadillidium vulgare]|nr:Zinc finger and BTB domain-containing protein 7A [Armadillidium vulgare]